MLLGSSSGEEEERREKRRKGGWGDVGISMTVTEMF